MVLLTTSLQAVPSYDHYVARFDQAYLALWLATEDHELTDAKKRVPALAFAWQKLERQWQVQPASEALSPTDAIIIRDWLDDAFYMIDLGELNYAQVLLSHARCEISAIRQAQGQHYFFDYLIALYDDVDLIAEAMADEQLCLMEWQELEYLVGRARREFDPVLMTYRDMELFRLTPARRVEVIASIDAVKRQLSELEVSMACADRNQVERLSAQLERNSLQLLRLMSNSRSDEPAYASYYPFN